MNLEKTILHKIALFSFFELQNQGYKHGFQLVAHF